MTIESAIKLAIEGGFEPHVLNWNDAHLVKQYTNAFLLDPDFWRCLGKSLGWGVKKYKGACSCRSCLKGTPTKHDWKLHWHSFVDHLAEGKTPESFFASLPEIR